MAAFHLPLGPRAALLRVVLPPSNQSACAERRLWSKVTMLETESGLSTMKLKLSILAF